MDTSILNGYELTKYKNMKMAVNQIALWSLFLVSFPFWDLYDIFL